MKYQNTITGAVIDIKSVITEGPWQAIEKPAIPSKKALAKRKAAKEKDG